MENEKKGIINVAFHQRMVFKRQTYKQKYESLYMHSFSFEYAFILVCTNLFLSCVSVIGYIKNSLLFMEMRNCVFIL